MGKLQSVFVIVFQVQEDLTEEKKRELEHNAEETYGENADDKNNDGEEPGAPDGAHSKRREEHYEEEEDEEEEGAAIAEKSHRRAEMQPDPISRLRSAIHFFSSCSKTSPAY